MPHRAATQRFPPCDMLVLCLCELTDTLSLSSRSLSIWQGWTL